MQSRILSMELGYSERRYSIEYYQHPTVNGVIEHVGCFCCFFIAGLAFGGNKYGRTISHIAFNGFHPFVSCELRQRSTQRRSPHIA